LEEDATTPCRDTQLEMQLVGQPKDVQAEIIRINTDARPFALLALISFPCSPG